MLYRIGMDRVARPVAFGSNEEILIAGYAISRIPLEETDPEGYVVWSRCNDMVHSWIINTVIPEISDSVIYYSTTQEMHLDQLSISAYYTKLKDLWDELPSYNDTVHGAQQDQQRLMQFLMGLNDSYSAIRGQILLINPLPSVCHAYFSVTQEEKQRLLSSMHTVNDSVDSAAMVVCSNSGKTTPFTGTGRSERPHQSYGMHDF
nr:uncharacterized protein LOC118035239 [Populus alba]